MVVPSFYTGYKLFSTGGALLAVLHFGAGFLDRLSVTCLSVLSDDREPRYAVKVNGIVGYEGAMVFERRGSNPSILR